MRHHRRATEPTTTCPIRSRGRFVRLGFLTLSAAGVVALAGFWVVDDPEDREGGPRFRATEQSATVLAPSLARP